MDSNQQPAGNGAVIRFPIERTRQTLRERITCTRARRTRFPRGWRAPVTQLHA